MLDLAVAAMERDFVAVFVRFVVLVFAAILIMRAKIKSNRYCFDF
jgi:hypothetical protein